MLAIEVCRKGTKPVPQATSARLLIHTMCKIVQTLHSAMGSYGNGGLTSWMMGMKQAGYALPRFLQPEENQIEATLPEIINGSGTCP